MTPIRRGTARRLGLRQPYRPGWTMTYVPRRPMHIVTAEELEQINKELIRAAWYQGLADSRKNAGRSR